MKSFFYLLLVVITLSSCGNNKPERVNSAKYIVQRIIIGPNNSVTLSWAKDVMTLDTLYKVGDTVLQKMCQSCDYDYYIIIRRGGQ